MPPENFLILSRAGCTTVDGIDGAPVCCCVHARVCARVCACVRGWAVSLNMHPLSRYLH